MPVFRVEKSKNFTVMSNHHLRNKELSLKAKGLFTIILSLPESWDYSEDGLSQICQEGSTAISSAIKELEKQGYIKREKIRKSNGQFEGEEYFIYENPAVNMPEAENPELEKPQTENPTTEKQAQYNKDIINTDKLKKEKINTEIINTEQSINADKKIDMIDEIDYYTKRIKNNIYYDSMCERHDKRRIDEIVDIMLEILCSKNSRINIAGDKLPAKMVKERILRLDCHGIEYIFECIDKNTKKVGNIKNYLKTTIFNAPSTIETYYTAEVNHDLRGDKNE